MTAKTRTRPDDHHDDAYAAGLTPIPDVPTGDPLVDLAEQVSALIGVVTSLADRIDTLTQESANMKDNLRILIEHQQYVTQMATQARDQADSILAGIASGGKGMGPMGGMLKMIGKMMGGMPQPSHRGEIIATETIPDTNEDVDNGNRRTDS